MGSRRETTVEEGLRKPETSFPTCHEDTMNNILFV